MTFPLFLRQFPQMIPIPPPSDLGFDDLSDSARPQNDSIYKIMPRVVWNDIRHLPSWAGSPDDLRDGFIHFSTRSQVDGTLRKHFSGQTDLVILEISANALGPNLRWEVSRNGDRFPHLYEPMPIGSVRSVFSVGNH